MAIRYLKSKIHSKNEDEPCLKQKDMKLVVRQKFKASFDQYRERDGQKFTLIGVVDTPDERHDAEVLPMFKIRFEDGYETEAWPEEVLR